eukprot:9915209-Alexandrium_andersonii.AAC.1
MLAPHARMHRVFSPRYTGHRAKWCFPSHAGSATGTVGFPLLTTGHMLWLHGSGSHVQTQACGHNPILAQAFEWRKRTQFASLT